MKGYTDLEQSKRLAEILPIESADMCWTSFDEKWDAYLGAPNPDAIKKEIPCWSLAALLDILSKSAYFVNEAGIADLSSIKATKWCVSILNCGKIENCYADNPIDAAFEMICWLKENGKL